MGIVAAEGAGQRQSEPKNYEVSQVVRQRAIANRWHSGGKRRWRRATATDSLERALLWGPIRECW